jgi:AraC-like DNA-binding protein
MLVDTTTSLREVTRMWGFADRSHFGKVFRRILHMSPAAYRRAIRRETNVVHGSPPDPEQLMIQEIHRHAGAAQLSPR